MDAIEKLIKALQEAKEELQKNMNQSYTGTTPNMAKGEQFDDNRKGREAGANAGEGDGVRRPTPEAVEAELERTLGMDKNDGFEALTMSENGQWHLEKKHIGFDKLQHKLEEEGHSKESAGNIAYAIGAKKYGKAGMEHKAHEAHKSECMEKDAADPKLAPKDVKVKQIKAQVDAGTYKPDAGKIAEAMLKPKK